MKKLLAFVLLAPVLAFAKPVSLDFQGVSLVAFSQATYKAVMGRDYVIAPEVLTSDRKITISVKNIDQVDLPAFVENILLQEGVAVTERNGVYYLNLASRMQQGAQGAHQIKAEMQQAMYGTALAASVPSLSMVPALDDRPLQSVESARGISSRRSDDESVTYYPKNRPTDFFEKVAIAAFGPNAVVIAGSRLLLTGSKADIARMTAVLDSLDSMPAKVDVSASWVEVTHSDGTHRGISLLANVLGAKLGLSLGSISNGNAISLKNTNFELVIDAINNDGRFNQVSNSRIVGDDYLPMALNVGDETPTVASSGKDNAGNWVQNIVYRPSGVIVNVEPKVLGSGRINLVIDGQISNFKATQTGVSGSPTLIKRQVKTSVTVGDGEVLLIGGLNDSSSTENASGFAFLPSSWSVKTHTKTQTDLVLILSVKSVGL